MRIGVLTFIENMIGGLGTQAYDFVRLAFRTGHTSRLFLLKDSAKNQYTPSDKMVTRFGPNGSGNGLSLTDAVLSTRPENTEASLKALSRFDVLVWVGVAPHFEEGDRQQMFFEQLLRLPVRHVCFATDKFVDKYYPWIKPHMGRFAKRFAFADPYANALQPYGDCEVLPIAPLDCWDSRKLLLPSKKPNKIFWPHQWRGWKNINLFLECAAKLEADEIRMYASGAGIEFSQFKKSPEYAKLVKYDVHNPRRPHNPKGKLVLCGFVNLSLVRNAYLQTAFTPDLTGISKGKKEPNSYVGNYQCATFEAMLLGSALLKMETTVAPHNGIPKDAVLAMPAGAADYADEINQRMRDLPAADRAAKRAFEWLQDVGEPEKCFKKLIGTK